MHIPYLQPFTDVNKRVSRLGANIPLIRHNLAPLTFIDEPDRAYIDAMLGVYELNRIELLRDLFVWAYERSAREYVLVRKSLAEPDPLRLRYRLQLHHLMADIVRNKRPEILQTIKQNSLRKNASTSRIGPPLLKWFRVKSKGCIRESLPVTACVLRNLPHGRRRGNWS